MISKNYAEKRKNNEYHDPDYANDCQPVSPRRQKIDSDELPFPSTSNIIHNESVQKSQRLREIIVKQLDQEIQLKRCDLEQIKKRLSHSWQQVDNLRRLIIEDFYKRQEIPLNQSETEIVQDATNLFDIKTEAPQFSLHPSLKKIIGKKPKNIHEILCTQPRRAAASTATVTMRSESRDQKRYDRNIQKIIRQKGIVIDHSKQNVENEIKKNIVVNSQKKLEHNLSETVKLQPESVNVDIQPSEGMQSLNRNNINKRSLLIIVGNTSQYVGNENDNKNVELCRHITHKWILYLLPKDKEINLNIFIKRVRFILHPSYAPNQVVDITNPPFQICRRGWGEFPVRIQIFFHECYQQKPLQFVHKLSLDKSFSGLHVLGSETVVQIWLRSIKQEENDILTSPVLKTDSEKQVQPHKVISVDNENCAEETIANKTERVRKKLVTSSKNNKKLDDNLLEFLNKINAVPSPAFADIHEIESTIAVTEPLKCTQSENVTTNNSISKTTITTSTSSSAIQSFNTQIYCETEKKNNTNNKITNYSSATPLPLASSAFSKLDSTLKSETNNNSSTILSSIATTTSISDIDNKNCVTMSTTETKSNLDSSIQIKSVPTPIAAIPKLSSPAISKLSFNKLNPSSNNNMNNSNIFNLVINKSVTKCNSTTIPLSANKNILQKKLVKIMDNSGNVKFMPIFVTTSNTNARPIVTSNNVIPSKEKNSSAIFDKVILTMNNNSSPNVKVTSENAKPSINTNLNVTSTNAIPITLTPTADEMKNHTFTQGKTTQMNTLTKNVFQVAGKVYMIDPLHSKIKQQKNKQESLLKPQVSLLKPQDQKQQQSSAQTNLHNLSYHTVVNDHDYVPSNLPIKITNNPTNKLNEVEISKDYKESYKRTDILMNKFEMTQPPLHLSIREARVRSTIISYHQEQARIRFEQQFQCYDFYTIISAVEFLLRRVPLVASKTLTHNAMLSSLGFVKKSEREFQLLPAFKQRSCEWLRAKYIERCLHSHKKLQKLNESRRDIFWTTREILIFARFYMYTPIIKSLETTKETGVKENYTLEVQNKLSLDNRVDSEIVTSKTNIIKWLDSVWPHVQAHELKKYDSQIIDVDQTDVKNGSHLDQSESGRIIETQRNKHEQSKLDIVYLQTPTELANEIEVLKHIFVKRNLKDLQSEEIDSGLMMPMAQILLAKALNIFIEKILREAVSKKLQQQMIHKKHKRTKELKPNININQSHYTCNTIVTNKHLQNVYISPEDISNVITKIEEFDFLSNKHFGNNFEGNSHFES